MNDPKKPEPGEMVIDASDVKPTDLTPEQIQAALKLREGVSQAIGCILRLKPEEIERIGFNPKSIQSLAQLKSEYDRAGELRPAAEKLVELLMETQIDRGHKIALLLGEMASQARRRGERDPLGHEILGPLAHLLEYQFGPATRAAATKRKAKKQEEQQPENGTPMVR